MGEKEETDEETPFVVEGFLWSAALETHAPSGHATRKPSQTHTHMHSMGQEKNPTNIAEVSMRWHSDICLPPVVR